MVKLGEHADAPAHLCRESACLLSAMKQEVREVLESVPEKYRTVLVLRDLENFSTAEIAGIMDRKEATIRWRLAEARQRFQKLWQKRLDEDAAAAGSRIQATPLDQGEPG